VCAETCSHQEVLLLLLLLLFNSEGYVSCNDVNSEYSMKGQVEYYSEGVLVREPKYTGQGVKEMM
jgi:hypothetical protein